MLIFVYGSLKEGFPNYHKYIKSNGARYKGTHITKPIYTMVSLGGFPGVYPNGKTAITGEVYDFPFYYIPLLDKLEGYPQFYNRVKIVTPYGKAWMWMLNNPRQYSEHRKIESGEWL